MYIYIYIYSMIRYTYSYPCGYKLCTPEIGLSFRPHVCQAFVEPQLFVGRMTEPITAGLIIPPKPVQLRYVGYNFWEFPSKMGIANCLYPCCWTWDNLGIIPRFCLGWSKSYKFFCVTAGRQTWDKGAGTSESISPNRSLDISFVSHYPSIPCIVIVAYIYILYIYYIIYNIIYIYT